MRRNSKGLKCGSSKVEGSSYTYDSSASRTAYQFSPHDTISGRLKDWLKSYSNHRKPKDLVGGSKWEGGTHVPCEKSK